MLDSLRQNFRRDAACNDFIARHALQVHLRAFRDGVRDAYFRPVEKIQSSLTVLSASK
jgi:hypothetical protein